MFHREPSALDRGNAVELSATSRAANRCFLKGKVKTMKGKFELIDAIVNDVTRRDLARCGTSNDPGDGLCNSGCGNEASCHDACCIGGWPNDTGGSVFGVGGDAWEQEHGHWPYRCNW